jgi:uncharacterized protein YjbI with pentapeptide repeats
VDKDFGNMNLRGLRLDGEDFSKATFSGASFKKADLRNSRSEHLNFGHLDLLRISEFDTRISMTGCRMIAHGHLDFCSG